MLDEKQIEANKERYISLLKTIKREGADIDKLINKLNSSDFFTAPASTTYHCSYKGGLCHHSLHVYDNLKMLDKARNLGIPDESLVIIGLLHDISKMNYYETAERNVKDEQGRWTKVPFIKTREAKDRFIYADHGMNSEYIARTFIPLTIYESVAIINHMGGKDIYSGAANATNMSEVFNRYPMALLLHTADLLATFLDEAIY